MSYYTNTYEAGVKLDAEGRAMLDFDDFRNGFIAVEEWLTDEGIATSKLFANLDRRYFYDRLFRPRKVTYFDFEDLCERLALDADEVFFEVFGDFERDWVTV